MAWAYPAGLLQYLLLTLTLCWALLWFLGHCVCVSVCECVFVCVWQSEGETERFTNIIDRWTGNVNKEIVEQFLKL